MVNKTTKLHLAIALGHDIIVLTKTHLDSLIPDGEIRKLNGRHGGGVLIATRDQIIAGSLETLHRTTQS